MLLLVALHPVSLGADILKPLSSRRRRGMTHTVPLLFVGTSTTQLEPSQHLEVP